MKFETNPQLFLTKDEFETLDNALKLCRDMDELTGDIDCTFCPRYDYCEQHIGVCSFSKARKALKEIIDMAVVK